MDAGLTGTAGLRLSAAPARVLLVATRRIGDVLLTTPLIASIHAAWPAAAIDVLVFSGTGAVLAGLPGIDAVIEVAERPRLREHLGLLRQHLAATLTERCPGAHLAAAAGDGCDGALQLARELAWQLGPD